ncbi:hypothetical protein AB2B38_006340 [Balneola sp. MJW-20]|uniref:hypothetical protein n=1 Tax=Gracilimonas aurantiaca TaxID=3234185 RepID=UPI003466FD2F
MKYLSALILFLLFFPVTLPAQELPDDPTSYYDFWVGEWDLTWTDPNGEEGTGINLIEKTLDGKVIQEHFEALSGQLAGFKGTSISVYNPSNGWHQAWADNNGGYIDLHGLTDGTKRIFQTKEQVTTQGTSMSRMVFYDISKDSFTWDWEASSDGGKTWKLSWRIYYVRR